MNRSLVIDFETKDPHLKKLGSGWVHGQIDIIGACIREVGEDRTIWYGPTQMEKLKKKLNNYDTLIAHNAQYDIGILKMLGVDVDRFTIHDTIIISKLYNNTLMSYSLDDLARKYLRSKKKGDKLGLLAYRHRLVKPIPKSKRTGKWKDKFLKYCKKYAMSNLDVMYNLVPKVVAEYCKQDVDLTHDLYLKLVSKVPSEWLYITSNVTKLLLKSRAEGVRVDLNKLNEVREYFFKVETENLNILQSIHPKGKDFNPGSTDQLSEGFDYIGIEYPINEPTPNDLKIIHTLEAKGNEKTIKDINRIAKLKKGRPSITAKFLDELTGDHPFISALANYRKYNKARRDFCDTVYSMQELLPGDKKGRVYPEFHIFGAMTGRFSCTRPNIQQIPSRDEDIGPLVRSIYIPEEGEDWYSLDFSSQESRLQVHYAKLIKAEGADLLALEFNNNPMLDLHQVVADMAGISRKEAKIVNLGLCLAGDTEVETYCGSKQLKDIEVGDLVFTREGEYKRVFEKTHTRKMAYRVTTSTGKELIGSKEHRVLVTKPAGNHKPNEFVYTPIGELVEGMYLTPNVMERRCGNGCLGLVEAHALGFWIAEGHYNKHDYQMQAKQKKNNFTDGLFNVFKEVGIRAVGPDKSDMYLLRYPKELRDKYVGIGLDLGNCYSRHKRIPRADYSIDEIRHLLCGLWEGDGHISTRSRGRVSIRYTTTSEGLADDVIYYLRKLGISAKKSKTSRFKERGIIDVLVVGNICKQLFLRRIPTAKNIHYKGKAVVTCERITRIEKLGVLDLYDIGVEDNHNFTANGLVVHNSYGMGNRKLAVALNSSVEGAKIVSEKYNSSMPFLSTLSKTVSTSITTRGYIKTLLGRKSRLDAPTVEEDGNVRTYEYKALNKLIQGSAADQVLMAMSMLYEAKIPILFSVHDEINLSAGSEEIAKKVKTIMETCVKLEVPMVSEIGKGSNWSEAK